VPGASAYFLGGGVIYTQAARRACTRAGRRGQGIRSSTEEYARLKAKAVRELVGATWGWRRRARAGRRATATATPRATVHRRVRPVERVITVETGDADASATCGRSRARR